MKIKPFLLFPVLTPILCLPLAVQASPLVSIGDHADVFFAGSSSLQWSSNLFTDEDDERDDLRWTLSPGFEVNVGRGASNVDLSITTRYDFVRYQDYSELDTETGHIKAIGSYSASRLDLNGSVSFGENQSNSADRGLTGANLKGQLIESEDTGASLNGEYRLSPKFSFGSGATYSEQRYLSGGGLADRDSITVPADVFYELTPKVDLSLGYSYQKTEVEAGTAAAYDQVSHYYNIGARGNLLPKLSGFFKIGYRDNEYSGQGLFGADADFSWSATPKLSANMRLSRDFGVAGEGSGTENTSAQLAASYSLNTSFAASANVGYALREYQGDNDRTDHQYSTGVNVSYIPNQYWRLSTGYSYTENDSNQADGSYVNHVLSLSASLRY